MPGRAWATSTTARWWWSRAGRSRSTPSSTSPSLASCRRSPAAWSSPIPDKAERVAGSDGAGQAAWTRTGFGSDRHPFGPGDGLRLGGIEIQGAPPLHGHSDGDAALHAVASALLGAAALGDLGDLYPADERTPRGEASSVFFRDVVKRLAGAGCRPAAIDVTIRAWRPRLAVSGPAIRSAIG